MGGNVLTALGPDNDSKSSSSFSVAADKQVDPSVPVFIEREDVLTGGEGPELKNDTPPTPEDLRRIGEYAAEIDQYAASLANDVRPQGRAA